MKKIEEGLNRLAEVLKSLSNLGDRALLALLCFQRGIMLTCYRLTFAEKEHTGMLRTFKDVQVAIVGIGRSNQALCRYLLKEGAVVTCFDRKAKEEL